MSDMTSDDLSRRGAFRFMASAAAVSTLGVGLTQLVHAAEAVNPSQPAGEAPAKRKWYNLNLMEDHILEQILVYYLGQTWQQMSDIGECLDTAIRIKAGDEWSWPREWEATARRIHKLAQDSEARGHNVSAGEAYLRASNYYIASLHHHPDPHHPGVRELALESVACFRKSIKHLDMPVEEVAIPYEGTTLPGYFYRSSVAKGKAPTMIIFNGRDAWAIQGRVLADEGNKRGYHVMLFDGPGQGQVLRTQGLAFRPDWEKVVTPVVDATLKMKGVDPDRIGVMGISMGGILAPRAAAFERRPKVYVANPPVVNWAEVAEVTVGQMVGGEKGLALVETNPKAFNAIMEKVMAMVPLAKWGMEDMYWKHSVSTPADVMIELRKYNVAKVAHQITSKMLLIHGTDDEWSQVEKLQSLLKAPSDLLTFDDSTAGQLHCQGGAWAILNHQMYDWLDENLKA